MTLFLTAYATSPCYEFYTSLYTPSEASSAHTQTNIDKKFKVNPFVKGQTILSSSGNNLHTENTFVGLKKLATIKFGQ